MAERRMMSKKIIHSDSFLDLPATTQNLYFHLMLEGDDEGFVNSPKRIQKMVGANDGDAQMLIAKKFIISFESGVIVIKHWRIHNYIQNDRFKKTSHFDERSKLVVKDNNAYSIDDVSKMYPNCTPSIGEDRLGKVRLGEDSIGEETRTLVVTPKDHIPYQTIIDHLNQTMQSHYKTIDKTKALIKARFNEGFDVDDFMHVHIVKLAEWGQDEKMSKFLRPETLYGNKFEGYRNQKISDYEKSRLIQQQTGMTAKEVLDIQLEAAEREWELTHAS